MSANNTYLGDSAAPIVTNCIQTECGSLNKFRCPVWHPSFPVQHAATSHLVVFPREAVVISMLGRDQVVATANVVMVYNQGQEYRRQKISDRGDRCDFFRFDGHLIAESIQRFDPTIQDRMNHPFMETHATISNQLYLKQRQLMRRVEKGEFDHDPLEWNLEAAQILDETIEQIFSGAFGQKSSATGRRAKENRSEIARESQQMLSRQFDKSLAIADIADTLDISPFHLARVFREYVGMSIQEYLYALRVRAALERLQFDRNQDLTRLALDLGFSSHSHFSLRFRKAFKLTPSQWRERCGL